MYWRKALKIEIINSDPTHPINPYLEELKSKLESKHSVSIIRSPEEITYGDILFLVSCSTILDQNFQKKFKHVMVIHASDLPKGRGWSPHVWELLNGADKITLSLLDAEIAVDSGDIYTKVVFDVPKSALWDEINELLFSAEIRLIEYAIENFDDLQKQPQRSDIEATYYAKRKPQDSEIDPEKSIIEQFDLLRICDPHRFPAFFHHRGETFKVILEKI